MTQEQLKDFPPEIYIGESAATYFIPSNGMPTHIQVSSKEILCEDVKYIRADLHEAALKEKGAEIERLQAELAEYRPSDGKDPRDCPKCLAGRVLPDGTCTNTFCPELPF